MTRRLLLAAILGLALIVRVWGIAFGLPFVHARPDELIVVSHVLGFFTRDLNPRFFDYPGLYLYLLGALYAVYYAGGRLLGVFTDPAQFVGGTHGHWHAFYLIGRWVTAIAGTLTVLWIYRVAAAVFSRAAGLVAALFLALAFLHVRDSHYATTDALMTFLIVGTVLALVRLHEGRHPVHALVAGLLAGLAMGTKYNAAILVAPMIVVELLHAWPNRRRLRIVVRGSYLPQMLVVMGVTFLLTTPYLVLDYRKALQDFQLLSDSMRTGQTPPDLLGPGWIYHFRFSLVYGLGIPLLASGLAGMVVAARRQPAVTAVLASFPIAYFIVAGASANVFVRYMMPVVPFLCLFAAVFVDAVAEAMSVRAGAPASFRLQPDATYAVRAALAAAIIAPSAWSVFQFDRLLAREDNRLIAARWVEEHVPYGVSVYTTGNMYGYPPLEDRIHPKYRLISFDYRANNFIEGRKPFAGWPDWIIVQRSALPYSHIPQLVLDTLPNDYRLVQMFKAADLDEPGNVYDIQDAFYLPYGGFRGVRRPGPNFEIYQKKGS